MMDHSYLDKLYRASLKSTHPWAKPPALLKRRAWAFEIYPDNKGDPSQGLSPTPEDWIKVLQDEFLHVYIIKHDKDKNPDGTEKKLHYHVMIMWDGPVTATYADQYRNMIGGVGMQPIANIKQYARYLCHLDNPEKYQYPITDVINLGINDYVETIEKSFNRAKCIEQMTRYIDNNDVKTFRALVRFSRDNNQEWYFCLMDNVTFLRQYIADKRYEDEIIKMQNRKEILDKLDDM